MTILGKVIKKREKEVVEQVHPTQQSSPPKDLIKAIKKKEKEMKHSHHTQQSISTSPPELKIEPPRLHRDMRLICDVFRISEESRYALRTFDAANLEDFSLMTEGDFIDMVATRARLGYPIPPLQQRKLGVLLRWAQSLPVVEPTVAPMQSEGFEVKDQSAGHDNVNFRTSIKKDVGRHTPSDWEDRFYADLPRLRKELRELGEGKSASNFISSWIGFRWLFCGG